MDVEFTARSAECIKYLLAERNQLAEVHNRLQGIILDREAEREEHKAQIPASKKGGLSMSSVKCTLHEVLDEWK